ncbi:MAG: hypothetical protein V7668_07170 [Cereibacter changlensis]
MNAITSITAIQFFQPAPAVVEGPPIVLRFQGLHPGDLGRFAMHDQRAGGDLQHVDPEQIEANRVEFGETIWIKDLRLEIDTASRQNLNAHVAALVAKSRKTDAAKVREAGLRDPWRRCVDGPLREGILTVNKAWFGGTGLGEWNGDRVEDFRTHAVAFLQEHFPGDQLRFASSHSDEEAFHLHFVVAVWTQRETANRGVQRLLQAAANPLLADYEHAQDMAGLHFEQIGLRRGECRAAARRAALAAGEPAEPKRRHVPPSRYRAEEKRKAEAEKARIMAEARVEADRVAESARTLGQAAIRKSRKRAVREAQALKVASAKEEAGAILRRDVAAAEAQKAKEAAGAARLRREEDEEKAAAIFARVGAQVEAAAEAINKVQSLKQETAVTEAALTLSRREIEAAEQRKRVARRELEKVEARKREASEEAMKARIAQRLSEKAAGDAKAEAEKIRMATLREARRVDALANGLELFGAGVLAWRPATPKRPESIVFGPAVPKEASERQAVVDTVAAASLWLRRLVKVSCCRFRGQRVKLA